MFDEKADTDYPKNGGAMDYKNIEKVLLLGLLLIVVFVLWQSIDQLEYNEDLVSEEEQVTIRFSSSWAGIDNKAILLESLIDDFEREYPYITVMNESMYGEDFLFTLKANFASGNGPDVFGLWPGSDLEMLIDRQLIADLSMTLAEDPDWYGFFDEKAFEYLDQGYQIYSIPFEVIYEGMFLNLDLFEKYHVNIPKDFEGLKEAVKAFRAVGITPIAYNLTPEGSFIYQNMIVQLAGKYSTENPLGRYNEVSEGYIEAMYMMRDLYQLGAFPEDAFTLDDASRNEMFINKEAAMIVQGSWYNTSAFGEDVTIIPFPIAQRDIVSVVYGVGNGNFHISKKAFENPKKKEASLLFLKYLTSNKGQSMFSVSPSFIGSRNLETDDYIKQVGLDMIKSADELVGPPDHYINRTFWESVLIKEFPNMLEGKIEPEDIFKRIGDY